MRDELKVTILGLGGLVFLETYALYKGVDGVMFGAAAAAVGAIIGYVIKSHLGHKKKRKK